MTIHSCQTLSNGQKDTTDKSVLFTPPDWTVHLKWTDPAACNISLSLHWPKLLFHHRCLTLIPTFRYFKVKRPRSVLWHEQQQMNTTMSVVSVFRYMDYSERITNVGMQDTGPDKPMFHLLRHVTTRYDTTLSSPWILAQEKVMSCCVALVGQHGATHSSRRVRQARLARHVFRDVATAWTGLDMST